MAEPRFPAPDPRDVDPRPCAAGFARAAATYDEAAVLQREVGTRMAQRLDYVKLAPAVIVDAGCGTGEAVGELGLRYPQARTVLAFDIALPMVEAAQKARTHAALAAAPTVAAADDARFAAAAVRLRRHQRAAVRRRVRDLVWSNLALQWVNDLPRAIAEFRRVLKVGGLLSFTTFGPDTLREIRAAFSRAGRCHVHEPVRRHARHRRHAGRGGLRRSGDGHGAHTSDVRVAARAARGAEGDRRHQRDPRPTAGADGRRRFERATRALEALRDGGRIPATFEVIYGHAWKVAPRRTPEGHAIVRVQRPGRN